MPSDTLTTMRWLAKSPSGSFGGLMALYESNWERFRLLVPALARLRHTQVSRVHADCSVYLRVVERTRYTTTVELSYLFADEATGVPVADPDLTVRVYHDTRQVEALGCAPMHRHELLRRLSSEFRELERRWRINLLLNKWLDYLLDSGHLFTGLTSQRCPAGLPARAARR